MTGDKRLVPVWWEIFPGSAVKAFDTGRRRFWGTWALIFYVDLDDRYSHSWVLSSELCERT